MASGAPPDGHRRPQGNGRLYLYIVFGGLGMSFDFAVFVTLLELGLGVGVASIAGYMSGTGLSFSLNSRLNFAVTDKQLLRVALFFSVATVAAALSALALDLLRNVLEWDLVALRVMVLAPFLTLQYLANRTLTFRKEI